MIFCLLTFRSRAAFLLARSSSRLPAPVPSHISPVALLPDDARLPDVFPLPSLLLLPDDGLFFPAVFFPARGLLPPDGLRPVPVLSPLIGPVSDPARSPDADLPASRGLLPPAALPDAAVLLPDTALPSAPALLSTAVLLPDIARPSAVILLPDPVRPSAVTLLPDTARLSAAALPPAPGRPSAAALPPATGLPLPAGLLCTASIFGFFPAVSLSSRPIYPYSCFPVIHRRPAPCKNADLSEDPAPKPGSLFMSGHKLSFPIVAHFTQPCPEKLQPHI